MNVIVIKILTEIVRIVVAAFLAALGVVATGCIACGDGAIASCVSSGNPNK